MNESYTRAPHRRPSAETARHTAALLIDFDNVTMGIRSNMGQELRNFLDSDIIRGKVAVQRAYADWRRYPQYIVPLSEASIDLIFAPAYGSSKKNATDIRLAIDALELVFTRPEIETFILLSGDSDFSSLVLKLKEYGKYVIGVGLQESTSDILVQNCDEYYSYNRLSGLTSADDIQTDKHDPWELTTRAVTRMAERGDVMRSDRLKQVMLEMDPGFDERAVGFSRFNRFLGEAAQREGIVLRKRENGQYEVAPPAGGAARADGSTGSRSKTASDGESAQRSRNRRGRRGGSGRGRSRSPASKPASEPAPAPEAKASDGGLQGAYDALARAVGDLSPGGTPVRDSMAKRKLLEYDSSFDEGSFGFSKFSLFLPRRPRGGGHPDVAARRRQPLPDAGRGRGEAGPAEAGPAEAGTAEAGAAEAGRRAGAVSVLGGRGRRSKDAGSPPARAGCRRGTRGAGGSPGCGSGGGGPAGPRARGRRERRPATASSTGPRIASARPPTTAGLASERGARAGRRRRGAEAREFASGAQEPASGAQEPASGAEEPAGRAESIGGAPARTRGPPARTRRPSCRARWATE